jgi:hypothetical protein
MQTRFLTHLEDFPSDLRQCCFEFFYWFSRFEFALKENKYVIKGHNGSAAPAWNKFEVDFAPAYQATKEAEELIASPPQRQVYAGPGRYVWKDTNLSQKRTPLGKAIFIIKTIRNNLFHGGKHDEKDWDNPERNMFLLTRGMRILDSLAEMDSAIYSDYKRRY